MNKTLSRRARRDGGVTHRRVGSHRDILERTSRGRREDKHISCICAPLHYCAFNVALYCESKTSPNNDSWSDSGLIQWTCEAKAKAQFMQSASGNHRIRFSKHKHSEQSRSTESVQDASRTCRQTRAIL
ncbi:unnamed protein product [Caenorhabditis brenneri]